MRKLDFCQPLLGLSFDHVALPAARILWTTFFVRHLLAIIESDYVVHSVPATQVCEITLFLLLVRRSPSLLHICIVCLIFRRSVPIVTVATLRRAEVWCRVVDRLPRSPAATQLASLRRGSAARHARCHGRAVGVQSFPLDAPPPGVLIQRLRFVLGQHGVHGVVYFMAVAAQWWIKAGFGLPVPAADALRVAFVGLLRRVALARRVLTNVVAYGPIRRRHAAALRRAQLNCAERLEILAGTPTRKVNPKTGTS